MVGADKMQECLLKYVGKICQEVESSCPGGAPIVCLAYASLESPNLCCPPRRWGLHSRMPGLSGSGFWVEKLLDLVFDRLKKLSYPDPDPTPTGRCDLGTLIFRMEL